MSVQKIFECFQKFIVMKCFPEFWFGFDSSFIILSVINFMNIASEYAFAYSYFMYILDITHLGWSPITDLGLICGGQNFLIF